MKYLKYTIGLVSLLLVSCSIQETEVTTPKDTEEPEFYASIEDESSRVYVDNQLRVLWNTDDRVSIFNKNTTNQEYYFTGKDGDNSGSFNIVSGTSPISGNSLDLVYSVYPYQASTRISNDGVISVTLPAVQTYEENSFGLGANTMVAVANDNELMYRNLCGFLAIKLYGDNVTVSSITIKGNNNEPLAGNATVNASIDGVPSLTFDSSATNEIRLTFETPVTLGTTAETATAFWFVVPPTLFAKGFTLIAKDEEGYEFVKVSSGLLEIKRNTISRTSPLDIYMEWPYSKKGIFTENDLIVVASELNKSEDKRDTRVLQRYGEMINGTSSWHFWLMNDISLTTPWTQPIGSVSNPFTGIFDGNNHSISGLNISGTLDYLALFGYTSPTAIIKDLALTNYCVINYKSNSINGVLCAYNSGKIENITLDKGEMSILLNDCATTSGGICAINYGVIENINSKVSILVEAQKVNDPNYPVYLGVVCGENKGTITGTTSKGMISFEGDIAGNIGGITGINNGNIYDSHNYSSLHAAISSLSGKHVNGGGIAGRTDSGIIENCSNQVDINFANNDNNPSSVGGIVGWNINCTILACCNFGSISSSYPSLYLRYRASAGGIVGWGGNCVACYNLGMITAKSGYAGGIAGQCGGNIIAYACYSFSPIPTGTQGDKIVGYQYNIASYVGCYVVYDGANTGDSVDPLNISTIIDDLNSTIQSWNTKFPDKVCNYSYYKTDDKVYLQLKNN